MAEMYGSVHWLGQVTGTATIGLSPLMISEDYAQTPGFTAATAVLNQL